MSEQSGNPSKKHKANNPDRTPGVIFTISSPSKLNAGSNALLGLFDAVLNKAKEDDTTEIIDDQSLNVSDEIARELDELSKDPKHYRFVSELSRGVGLIGFKKSLRPSDFVYSLLKNHCPSVAPLFVSRLLPVDVVCAPNLTSFESVIVPAISAKFKSFEADVTWKIVLDKHGLTNLTKEKIIDMTQSVIEERHEVSISSPEIVIMIQVCQSMCGVGFLREYEELAEYNIRRLIANRISNGVDT